MDVSANRRANRHRGEIEAELGGTRYMLCLTLGALAELETAFGVDDLAALAERFASGRLSSRDVTAILLAGLRGGGNDITADDLANMPAPGGASGYVAIVAELLTATFGGQGDAGGEAGTANPPQPQASPGRG